MGKRWAIGGLVLNARYVGAGSPRFDEGTQAARGPRSRLGRRAALVCAGLALAMLAVAVPAAASTTASTKTFNYTGDDQNWTVPARVTSATFDLRGAQGGQFLNHGIAGLGGQATATIGVTPGHTIEVNVGGQGTLHMAADPGFTLRTYVHLMDEGVGDAEFFDVAVCGNARCASHPRMLPLAPVDASR
jgi:hypothetical protein